MFKVMILDDEAIARIGLVHSIPWEENGYCIVGEASTIQDATAIALKEKPDIILVDIILRNENGLTFIEAVQDLLPLTKFILITCTDNSDFYRKAISLHVSEFISKGDMTAQELLTKLNKTAQEIRRERLIDPNDADIDSEYINRHALLNSYINQHLIQKNLVASDFLQHLTLSNVPINFEAYVIICLKKVHQKKPAWKNLNSAMVTLCSEILSGLAASYTFSDYKDHIILILSAAGNPLSRENLHALCYRLITTIFECFNVSVIAGVSDFTDSLDAFFTTWEHATHACDQYFFSDTQTVFFYKNDPDQKLYISRVEHELVEIQKIHSSSMLSLVLEHVSYMYEILQEYPYCNLSIILSLYSEVLNYILKLAEISIIDFADYTDSCTTPQSFIEQAETLSELNAALTTFIQRIHPTHPAAANQDALIATINSYIQQNLEKNITLTDITEKVHYTSSHISKYYKKKTGVNLKDYMIDCKIQKAIELLQAGNSVTFVSEHLAFCSTSHFIYIFKNRTGETPQKYIGKSLL